MIRRCTVPDVCCTTDVIIFDFGPFFGLLHSEQPKKSKLYKNEKEHLEITSFYTSVPKIMILCSTVPEIWCITDVIVIFHFGLFLTVLYPPTAQKIKISKK